MRHTVHAALLLCLSALVGALPLVASGERLQAVHMGVAVEQWPQTGERVHAPVAVRELLPGQGILVAVQVPDPSAEAQVRAAAFDLELEYQGKAVRMEGKRLKLFKRLLPEGQGAAPGLGVLDCDYQIPSDGKAGRLSVRCTEVRPDGQRLPMNPMEIPVRDMEEALAQERPFPGVAALDAWMKGYHRDPTPGKLLAAIRLMSFEEAPYLPITVEFFVEALRGSPAAARGILGRMPFELHRTRVYAGQLLQWAGCDIHELLPLLDEEARKSLAGAPKPSDPCAGISDQPEGFKESLNNMDRLWGSFMATGRPQPIMVLVQMLQWRKEYKLFEKLGKKKKLPPTPTRELVRGCLYKNAGVSLRAFLGSMPQLEDLLDGWKASPATPKAIREELAELPANASFKPERP